MERKNFNVEICAGSVTSCKAAQDGGADRVELCGGLPEGGTTPSVGMIRRAREVITIGMNVIIRPRGGDFLYSESEVRQMEYDIYAAQDAGADGLVFGALTGRRGCGRKSNDHAHDCRRGHAGDIPQGL